MEAALNIVNSSVTALSATAGIAPVAGGGANADDAARFAQLMAPPAGGVDASSGVGAAGDAVAIAPVSATPNGPSSLGDAILHRLGALGDGYAASVEDFHASLDKTMVGPDGKTELGLAQLLDLQMRTTEMSIQIDVITKIVQQTGQHINELGKLQ